MYQITRKNRIQETLQFRHADGTVALSVNVDLNIDTVASRVYAAQEAIAKAQAEIDAAPTDAASMEAFGHAVLALFEVVFGKEDTARIVEFYGENVIEMIADILPFIACEILPKIKRAGDDKKNAILAAAGIGGYSAKKTKKKRK